MLFWLIKNYEKQSAFRHQTKAGRKGD